MFSPDFWELLSEVSYNKIDFYVINFQILFKVLSKPHLQKRKAIGTAIALLNGAKTFAKRCLLVSEAIARNFH